MEPNGKSQINIKVDKQMKTIMHSLMTSFLAILLLSVYSTQGVGPLPEFTFKGIALHPDGLSYAPTEQLVHPSIIKMEGRVKNPLGRYYMYYSPHKHIAISMVYSDNIEGHWKEYQGNPVIEGPSAPDIRWIEEKGKFYMWGHRKNSQTELWTSDDGLRFEYKGISITAKNIGTRNATYTRVYEYPLKRYGSKYIMLYSGFIEERGIRCVWLAHSTDDDPSLLQWENRNFIVYQDHTSWRGGNIKYVEVDRELHPIGNKGERFVLMDPPPNPPLNDRYRGAEFYLENETLYMYSSASSKPRIIVYATANAIPDPSSEVRTRDDIIEQASGHEPSINE
jgi:hypothetical protein